ncbi:N-acetylmuramoyl-L-alanine amidase [Phaeobacter sp. CNT1-3]|nr:N-acetylmuramoyl-L-alanine amidase [Phaeobacter sp. CNT1-3]
MPLVDMNIIQHPSPNFGERRDGARPETIVLHYTAMPTAQAALARLSDPAFEVSAHYLIGRCGQIWQMVDEEKRAWHAGAGAWGGLGDVNSRSIGIELSNSGAEPFSERLMTSLEALLADLMARWDIPAQNIIGHSDMAPGRKIDPGARFDWPRLEQQGMARLRGEAGQDLTPDPARLRALATVCGYPEDVSDDALLEAVRLRYRRGALGPLCAEDLRVLG